MEDARPPPYRHTLAGEQSERRKVRKGTQSCWECKRRKSKCTFSAPRNGACDGCKRRGTLCVSQELPHVGIPTVGERLGRVEALVEELIKSAETRGEPIDFPPRQRRDLRGQVRSSIPNAEVPAEHELDPEKSTGTRLPPKSPSLNTRPAVQYDEIYRELSAAWPSAHNLDIILSTPVVFSGCLHGLISMPNSSTQSHKASSLQDTLQLPPPGSHPVLVARKLLILGSYLQAVPPSGIQSLATSGVNYHNIMSRVVETAHRLVNCNDELVGSIEGIECIAIESMYHNNAGNLRRSWLTIRRALLIAQMMGLHRGGNPSSMKTLERRTCIRPDYMWFRLVQSDRYLSLMLGLPQSTPNNSFATEEALESCTPTECLRRIDCAVGGRILQRNDPDINDLASTQEIDKLLQKASASMPPQWWLIPDITSSANDNMIRLMDQLAHYHLVARLHLPYLLRSSADRRCEYSKIMTVNASREVLARFLAFRSSSSIGSYCRGVDFLVFIASTTLCLAHIDAHRQDHLFSGDTDDSIFFKSLAHQRPIDRGMMERALENVQQMAHTGVDVIASRIAAVFRYLLVIEADAASGHNDSIISFANDEEALECGGGLSDGGNVLRIDIPSFGTFKIQSDTVSRSTLIIPSPLENEIVAMSMLEASITNPGALFNTSSLLEKQDQHVRQLINMLDCSSRNNAGEQSVNLGHSQFSPLMAPHDFGFQASQNIALGVEIDTEDQALEGVDMALFDSLTRGSDLDAAEMSHCNQ